MAVLLAGFLTGCAMGGSKPDDGGYAVRLDADSALEHGVVDGKPLVAGELRFKTADQFLKYDASYRLNPGANLLAKPDPAFETAVPVSAPTALLGAESLGQRIDTRLPFFEAPLQVGVQDRYQGLLAPQSLTSTRSADLKWNPAPAQIGVQWRTIDPLAPQPLDCTLNGTLDVPGKTLTASSKDTLKLSGSDCRVFAPDRGIAELGVSAFSAAWQWRGKLSDNAVHLTVIEPQHGLAASDLATGSAYELGASRSQKRGSLSAKASVAVRKATDPNQHRDQVGWSARTTITQQFDSVAVSASLQHATDPLWFVPASASGGNTVELGFDFRRWIDRQLATTKVGLGLLWSWTQPPIPTQPIDARVLWTLSFFH